MQHRLTPISTSSFSFHLLQLNPNQKFSEFSSLGYIMAGKGKNSKNKGKSKSNRSQKKQSGFSSFEVDENQKQSKLNADKNDWNYVHTNKEMEVRLHNKIEKVFFAALQKLMAMGYKEEIARRGLFMNGQTTGPKDIMTNLLENSSAFIKAGISTQGYGNSFQDLSLRIDHEVSMLKQWIKQTRPDYNNFDIMRHLLAINIVGGPDQKRNSPPLDKIEGSTDHKDDECAAPADSPSMQNKNDESDEDTISPLENNESVKKPDLLGIGVDLPGNVEEWLKGKTDDEKNEMIMSIVQKIKDCMVQMAERQEWAKTKVLKAEERVSQSLAELKLLRMEKIENEKFFKIAKQEFEEKQMKKLVEVQNDINKATSQVNFLTQAEKRLETENSEIRADMEAWKLRKSEAEKELREAVKNEKKMLKKALALEKQCGKLKDQIEGPEKEMQLKQELIRIKEAQEEFKLRINEQKEKEKFNLALVEEEKRLMKATEENMKRKQKSVSQEIEISFQRLKDDKYRLEDDLSKLRIPSEKIEESYNLDDNCGEQEFRPCVLCLKNEALVLLLPCEHLVLCTNCNEEKIGEDMCPCCKVHIDWRVRVYGPSS